MQKNYLKKEVYLLQTNSKASGGILMNQKFYDGIKDILITVRNKVYKTANFAMVKAYWNIGKSIIQEQGQTLEPAKKPEDIIRDPYVLEFLGLSSNDDFYESDLEQALITHLQKFLLELGRGFSFVARQKRITFDGRHFRNDLVFYNYI